MIDEALMKVLREETQEASWCKTCASRKRCGIKEEVAFEERMLSYGPRKYVKVKAECGRYIKGLSEQDKERTLIEDLKKGLLGYGR